MDVENLLVDEDASIKYAVKKMDLSGYGIACIADKCNNIIGIITDGDFRRAILNDVPISESVKKIMRTDFLYLQHDYSENELIDIFKNYEIKHVPILFNKKLEKLITRENVINKKIDKEKYNKLNCAVVIMAGGKGTRLEPFTNVFPKPLVPIGKKTMIEIVIESFLKFQPEYFFVTINHKADLIKSYFNQLELKYKISFIEESKPLGT